MPTLYTFSRPGKNVKYHTHHINNGNGHRADVYSFHVDGESRHQIHAWYPDSVIADKCAEYGCLSYGGAIHRGAPHYVFAFYMHAFTTQVTAACCLLAHYSDKYTDFEGAVRDGVIVRNEIPRKRNWMLLCQRPKYEWCTIGIHFASSYFTSTATFMNVVYDSERGIDQAKSDSSITYEYDLGDIKVMFRRRGDTKK